MVSGMPPMKFLPCLLTRNTIVIYLDFHSTKQALWLVDSWSDALIKFKCILTRIQLYSCCPQAKYNSTWLFKGESNKALNVWSLGKLVSFVFPQVLMFPLTSPQETSGLQGVKLRLRQAPMRLNFSLWRPNPES